ncbi:hypothetical protein ACQRBF_03680 [Peptoniphilaceae bacterium SGI.131]
MKPFRLLSSIFVIFVAFIFVYFIAYFFIDNSDLVYVIARVSGVNEKFADNISLLVLTVQSLIITSDWCYGKISKFLEKRVNKASKYTQSFYVGLKIGVDLISALPKRTILFVFYLILIVLELTGIIVSAKDYSTVAIFIIAIDRVGKIWPNEKEKLFKFFDSLKSRLEIKKSL